MAQTATTQTAREASLARRRALTSKGKAAIADTKTANSTQVKRPQVQAARMTTTPGIPARLASRKRRDAMSVSGKAGISSPDRTRNAPEHVAPSSLKAEPQQDQAKKGCGCGCDGTKTECKAEIARGNNKASPVRRVRSNVASNPSRAVSLARRQAMSTRGKAGINASSSPAQVARAANSDLSSRELSMVLREQRSQKGKGGAKKSQPTGRIRKSAKSKTGAAADASWKVGASETAHGQTLTGTMVGRSENVTGDEPSTCRTVTGTDYLGADIFRKFCQTETGKTPRKVAVTTTSHGNPVSGNKVGRASNVTGNEPGTCKRVTGNEYISAEQSQGFCGEFMKKSPSKISKTETRKGKPLTGNNVGRSENVTGDETGASRELTGTQYMQQGNGQAPSKVGKSATLRGGSVSGTMTGRHERVTGDEPGSCRNVTGDEYTGQEQYSGFCSKTPQPADSKSGVSSTLKGKFVTGTMTDRSGKVTGDEPGTCKAISGTPYASADQYTKFCNPEEAGIAAARTQQRRATPGMVMTGQQPGIGGKMTGDKKGACENVSGTPYVGADQYAGVCPATAADTASPDYPQPVDAASWNQFSVKTPAGEAQQATALGAITGSRYEQGQITGPFGMATGKVTGTEEARFGHSKHLDKDKTVAPATSEMIEGRVKSRISGEGMDSGQTITGDDWDRGDRVTGTEGTSTIGRNPTIRSAPGVAMAAAMATQKRNEELPVPNSKVTGGSGNTEKGSLITYSGGARG
jgi:hypothetical protein